jgi:outer membrane lipoprotein-sorting protein
MAWGPAVFASLLALSAAAGAAALAQSPDAGDVMHRVRTAYGELRSYADTGTVTVEYGTSSVDRHTFATAFIRAPRAFRLDVTKQAGDRYVVWGNPEAFATWWKATGQRFDYPNPNNAPAISTSGRNTAGVGLKIPTLLYATAPLGGDFANLAGLSVAGREAVGGRACHVVAGSASDTYAASGREVNVRRLRLWIDAETFAIRRVVEEWPAPPGQRSRTITSYEPQFDPALDASGLTFTPPSKP